MGDIVSSFFDAVDLKYLKDLKASHLMRRKGSRGGFKGGEIVLSS